MNGPVLLLTRSQLSQVVTLGDLLPAMARAFTLHHQRPASPPGIMHIGADGGEFHVKGGGLHLDRLYVALKANSGFFGNPARGLPSIQGLILLFDGSTGRPLAVLDSRDITLWRTAATTAVAAAHLARRDSATLLICGAGAQAEVHLDAMLVAGTGIERVVVWARDHARAAAFAVAQARRLGRPIEAAADVGAAAIDSDVIVTCTPATSFYLRREDVRPGTFVAAVGADSPGKQELDPAILAGGRVVVDILDQCARVGELHHALDDGLMDRSQVHAELGAVLAGAAPGGPRADVVTVFDSTGSAVQDTAAAVLAYEKATAMDIGTRIDMQA